MRFLRKWIANRFGIELFSEHVLHRRVVTSPWYFGDGFTLMLLLGTLVLTGMLMALTYAPTPEGAYQSVLYMTHQQVLGRFIRGLHYWSAGMMVVMLLAHVLRQILVGGYKAPREGTWLIGVGIFFLVVIMAFTGYTLRWDERAVHAIRVALHMFYYVPGIGEWLVIFIQGGPLMGSQTLTRLYTVHVILVPALLGLLVLWHLYLIILHGVTSPLERRIPVETAKEQKKLYKEQAHSEKFGEDFYPHTVLDSGLMAAGVFSIVVALTLLVGPPELMAEANLVDPSFPSEEWWFWWVSGLIALLPPGAAQVMVVMFPILLFLAMVLLPLLDRNPHRGWRRRPFAAALVLIIMVSLLSLTALRKNSPWTGWPLPEPPPVPEGIVLDEDTEEGRILFARFGCTSCHPIAGVGYTVGVDLGRLREMRSRDEIREFTLRPPAGIPMPAYEEQIRAGHMTEEELDRIVSFVLVAQTFHRTPPLRRGEGQHQERD